MCTDKLQLHRTAGHCLHAVCLVQGQNMEPPFGPGPWTTNMHAVYEPCIFLPQKKDTIRFMNSRMLSLHM